MNMIKNLRKIALFVFIITLILSFICGCSGNENEESTYHNTSPDATGLEDTSKSSDGDGLIDAAADETGKEAKYYPSAVLDFKAAYNESFDFWFDIPEAWKAFDRSENGDGYFIVPDKANTDIRVYGMYKTGTDEEFFQTLAGKKGTTEDFVFSDGAIGKKVLITGAREYFVRMDGDTYICFYISFNDNLTWVENNAETLLKIAESLRTRKEAPKLDSSVNKITLEDLMLGGIYIDMPYVMVKEKMETEIKEEKTDELGGRILFYMDNTEIYIIDDSVYNINVTSSDYPTPRGLKVGDDEARVLELYGKPDNSDIIDGKNHLGYTFNGYELFSIFIKDGKVSELQIDMVQ